jgi:LysM repeat protein
MQARYLRPSLALAVTLTALLAPASASAYFQHVVAPGETLTSVAAQDGLSIAALAAANGLSPDAELVAGTALQIPPQGIVPTYTAGGSGSSSAGYSEEAAEGEATATPVAATSDSGGYVVQPGDTLTAIAQRAGTSVAELAAANGLDPNGVLLAGATLHLSGGGGTTEYVSSSPSTSAASSAATAEGQPVGSAALGDPAEGPYPTHETVSAPEIASIASANGVPAALAQAVGWQESGWNNDEVSSTGAVGVMQIEPGTWNWIQRTLTAGTALSPASAADNVRGGSLLLHSLLSATGSSSMAAAAYYQGLSSVQQHGLYPDTQQYVNDVMSLEQRFAGGG